jgi:hypothetical protein
MDYHDTATLSATLRDDSLSAGTAVPAQAITFTLGSQACVGITDSAGRASCTLVLNQASGAYSVIGEFAGSSTFQPSRASSQFAITREETTLAYAGDATVANGGAARLSAILKEDGTVAIAGRTVTFTLGSGATVQKCSALTDANGLASCSINAVDQPLGPGSVSASFAGDSFYRPASATSATLLFAFAGGGSFVIGDQNAVQGTSVTYWGAQWAKLNSLSGGDAPSSFEGFADTTSNPPTCGATWSADPGNSSPPPQGVPSYMAVIAASTVSKSGPVVNGNTVSIVIVRTDPGYGPNPGHAGTATVVGVLCP